MAKTFSESGNPETTEKQEPEIIKKTSQGLSLPVIIGIVCGVIIVNVVIIIVVFKFVLAPSSQTSTASQSTPQKSEATEKISKSSDEMDEGQLSEEDKEKLILWEIKNIPATPHGMDKSAFFTVKFVCIPKEKKLYEKLSKKFDEDVTGKSLIAETEFKVNDIFSKYSREQIEKYNRDSLNIMLFKQIKPAFDKEDITLRKLLITWAFY
jgi:hypothetical protein